MTEKTSWFHSLPKIIGLGAGIVLTAIGGAMMFNSVLKLYVFDIQTSSYFNPQELCEKTSKYDIELQKDIRIERTPEEIKKCVEDKTIHEKESYKQRKEEDLIDALALLLIGIPFWIFFSRKRKK